VKALTAGSEIDAWCTKCRLDLGHRIVAMVKGAPKRVICLTCNSEHNYRAAKSDVSPRVPIRTRGDAAPRSQAPAGVRAANKARAEQERYDGWASRTLGKAVDAFARYSMERTFRLGELVQHPKFGEGYVEQVLEGGKINVMFRDGPKVLAHRPPG
jgi:hypothetical protein